MKMYKNVFYIIPQILSGASSSSSIGCCRNISLDLVQRPLTSDSDICTVFPGLHPRTTTIFHMLIHRNIRIHFNGYHLPDICGLRVLFIFVYEIIFPLANESKKKEKYFILNCFSLPTYNESTDDDSFKHDETKCYNYFAFNDQFFH